MRKICFLLAAFLWRNMLHQQQLLRATDADRSPQLTWNASPPPNADEPDARDDTTSADGEAEEADAVDDVTDEDDEGTVEDEEEEDKPKTKKVETTVWDWVLVNDNKPIWTRKSVLFGVC